MRLIIFLIVLIFFLNNSTIGSNLITGNVELSSFDQEIYNKKKCIACTIEVRLPFRKLEYSSYKDPAWYKDQIIVKTAYTDDEGDFQFIIDDKEMNSHRYVQLKVEEQFVTYDEFLKRTVTSKLTGYHYLDINNRESHDDLEVIMYSSKGEKN